MVASQICNKHHAKNYWKGNKNNHHMEGDSFWGRMNGLYDIPKHLVYPSNNLVVEKILDSQGDSIEFHSSNAVNLIHRRIGEDGIVILNDNDVFDKVTFSGYFDVIVNTSFEHAAAISSQQDLSDVHSLISEMSYLDEIGDILELVEDDTPLR